MWLNYELFLWLRLEKECYSGITLSVIPSFRDTVIKFLLYPRKVAVIDLILVLREDCVFNGAWRNSWAAAGTFAAELQSA